MGNGAPVGGKSAKTSSAPGAPLPGQSVTQRVIREVTVGGGRFAPGHLGELTQIVPFEMVDAVLAETGAEQVRVRALPSRVVIYLLLAAALFGDCGYRQVWARLVAGLDGLAVARPSAAGLAAPVGQVHQAQVAGAAVDEGADRR